MKSTSPAGAASIAPSWVSLAALAGEASKGAVKFRVSGAKIPEPIKREHAPYPYPKGTNRWEAGKMSEIESAVSKWCRGTFILRSGYYSGRGCNRSDLNSKHLEMIYSGISANYGTEQAEGFVHFVAHLTDLSASAFIQAFQRWWEGGCCNAPEERKGDRFALSGYGAALEGEALGCIASAMFPRMDDSADLVRGAFLRAHGADV